MMTGYEARSMREGRKNKCGADVIVDIMEINAKTRGSVSDTFTPIYQNNYTRTAQELLLHLCMLSQVRDGIFAISLLLS